MLTSGCPSRSSSTSPSGTAARWTTRPTTGAQRHTPHAEILLLDSYHKYVSPVDRVVLCLPGLQRGQRAAGQRGGHPQAWQPPLGGGQGHAELQAHRWVAGEQQASRLAALGAHTWQHPSQTAEGAPIAEPLLAAQARPAPTATWRPRCSATSPTTTRSTYTGGGDKVLVTGVCVGG